LSDVTFPEHMWEWVSCHETKISKTGWYSTRKELSGSIFNMFLYWKARCFVSIV